MSENLFVLSLYFDFLLTIYAPRSVARYTEERRSLVVFSHNDLLLGNIIYNKTNKSIKFIDYEYSHINYQAYDIANHFNEFAGVDRPDYTLYPSREFQLQWLRVYLESFHSKLNRFYTRQSDDDNNTTTHVDDRTVERFCDEVGFFTLLSHFMWATWALVQAQSSLIDFDFVWYANVRFDEYFRNKSSRMNSSSS